MLERFLSTFDGYTATDFFLGALDVFLVYYIIYRTLLLIKGTKAVEILVGLVLIAVFFFISKNEYLGLTTLHWLLDRFMVSFMLILVILFQDDIRRGLSQVGRSRAFSSLSNVEQGHFLEEIVKATEELSVRSLGGLIVLERTASIDDQITEGIPIDAAVSKELLVALFVPYKANPTHDGAVIIRGGRISAAGCFLPSTRNPHIERMLGTRHRAAIGLSEITDAVIVVVSEETGAVSVAFQDELKRGLDSASLRALLQKYLSSDTEEDSENNNPHDPLSRSRIQLKSVRAPQNSNLEP